MEFETASFHLASHGNHLITFILSVFCVDRSIGGSVIEVKYLCSLTALELMEENLISGESHEHIQFEVQV